MIRVTHVTNTLDVGGAERMLLKLIANQDRSRFQPTVIGLLGEGPIGNSLRELGVRVETLGLHPEAPQLRRVGTLARLLRSSRPDIVQTWVYQSDFLGGLAARIATPRARVIWGLRGSPEVGSSPPRTLQIMRVCARLSGYVPARIVSCSERLVGFHADVGYRRDRMCVIPNGFDFGTLRRDPGAAASVRSELGVPSSSRLVGLVGRYDPQKDHATFVAAAGRLLSERDDVHFILCGLDVDDRNADLTAAIARASRPEHFHLLGRRSDITRLNSAFDIAVSSSAYGEGFSNTLGEAMACGTSCVTTDVGDSATIVDGHGIVVPPRNEHALAEGIAELLDLAPDELARRGKGGRDHVRRHFDIQAVARQYEELWAKLARSPTSVHA
jgi:glycosyltransferase involved in cell wall biosynthesis